MTGGKKLMKIKIDGREIECEPGKTVFDVARSNGIYIPTLCYNPMNDMKRLGACRLCVVEILEGGRPGLQSSCTLPVSNGLGVSTTSEPVFQARRTVTELLLSEHKLDCVDCPKSGDCTFARQCRDYDLYGVPVCAECPRQKDGCLLASGVLCLGPITYAGCKAICTRTGGRCTGCNTTTVNKDVLMFGAETFKRFTFSSEKVLEAMEVFSATTPGKEEFKKAAKEVGL